MVLSYKEKKKMEEIAMILQESIVKIAEDRNIEIDKEKLIDFEVIEDKFDIHAKRPRFFFNWQKSKKGWNISKDFVSEKKMIKIKKELEDYLDKFEE